MTWWFLSLCGVALLSALVGTVRYYSTRKLKEQIRALEKEQAIRKERERISRDLHDNVGSQLTFLISSIDNLTFSRSPHPSPLSEGDGNISRDLRARLQDVSAYGRKTIKELRNTIWAMKHEDTDIEHLILKLNEFKQEVNSRISNLHMEINNYIKSSVTLSTQQILSLYRIIQEAIQNVIKHSGATEVHIEFSSTKDKINLAIHDNGKGFDVNKLNKGNGLNNMKSRCKEASGELQIESGKDGTTIKCMFKIN